MHPLRSSDPEGEGDLSRLEEHVLGLLGEGGAIAAPDLRREFPHADEADIQRVQTSAEILHAWLDDLGGPDASADRRSRASWLAPGERIGGYVILRRIHGGGMGQVYHAVQESLYPRRVALKVHRLGRDADGDLRRARREAEVASRLFHPHLAAIHDMGTDEERGLVYFSMQLVEGGDLRAAFREAGSALDAAAARRIATRISEVAGALAELHGRGYVHRDVKPENILLRRNAGRDGQCEAAVLVDFGLVRAERALHGERVSLAGTPGYVPPEAESGASVAPAGDVYSLGVVLYDALSGASRRRDPRGGPARVLEEELGSLATRGVDRDLSAIVARATRTDPGERYPDAGALQSDLERWLAGDAVSARRAPVPERLWRAARRRPRRTALVLVATSLVAALVFLAGSLMREWRDVRRGLAALERGEPTHGWETLAAANPLVMGLLLANRAKLRGDLLNDTQESPLTLVARAEIERGPGAALEIAAAHLERDGYQIGGVPTHPELAAFLTRSLGPQWPEERSTALRVAARLLFERPAEAPDLAELAPVYDLLVALLGDSASSRTDQLHVVSALGGCGRPADLDTLVAHAHAAVVRGDFETVRLTLTACERILRRLAAGQGLGIDDPVDWPSVEQQLGQLWREMVSSFQLAKPTDRLAEGWSDLAIAWALACRRTGYQPQLAGRLTEGPVSWFLTLQAAMRESPSIRGALLASAESRVAPDHYRNDLGNWGGTLGQACAYLGETDLRQEMASRLADAPDMLRGFETGYLEVATDLKSGFQAKLVPDSQSRLRRLLEGTNDTNEIPFSAGALPEAVLALWRFRPLEMAGGSASGQCGSGARWADKEGEPPHLRLARSGAWFEGRFTLSIPNEGGYSLVLVHLAASRPYLPFEGQAWVRVELDDVVLADRIRVGLVGPHELSLRIDPHLLTVGEHVVRVTAVEASTTYWIREIQIEPQ
jgi:hypothetical protein